MLPPVPAGRVFRGKPRDIDLRQSGPEPRPVVPRLDRLTLGVEPKKRHPPKPAVGPGGDRVIVDLKQRNTPNQPERHRRNVARHERAVIFLELITLLAKPSTDRATQSHVLHLPKPGVDQLREPWCAGDIGRLIDAKNQVSSASHPDRDGVGLLRPEVDRTGRVEIQRSQTVKRDRVVRENIRLKMRHPRRVVSSLVIVLERGTRKNRTAGLLPAHRAQQADKPQNVVHLHVLSLGNEFTLIIQTGTQPLAGGVKHGDRQAFPGVCWQLDRIPDQM